MEVLRTNTDRNIHSSSPSFSCTFLCALTADAACELHVLGHDGDPLGVDSAQVGVLEQTNEVALSCLLESHHRGRLEPKIGFVVLGDLTHETLEGQLADEELGGLLVLSDLTVYTWTP